MPVRGMLYDAMNYAKQVTAAATAHRKGKDKLTEEEFLSGFGKDDRLMPVITLTVSLSPDEWDGSTSLHEMLDIEDRGLLEFIPDYKLNLLTPSQIAEGDFDKFRTEVGILLQCVKHRNDKNMDWMEGNAKYQEVSRSTASMVKSVTGFDIHLDEEGDVVNMWNAWENGLAQARLDAEQSGRQAGIDATREENALAMFADHLPVEKVAKYSNLPQEAVTELGKKHGYLK